MTDFTFDYDRAFDRNIGWVNGWEQQALRHKRVAIAGLGGVGGVHMLTLARLGIGHFHIADLDTFDLPNLNRQVGAMMSTMGRPKVDVLAEMARDINPEIRVTAFPAGIDPGNIDAFLRDIDLFVDGFDFFALGIRAQVFARAYALGIPAITAAPIGMGTGFLVFQPGGMSFEQYFRLEGQSENEQYLRFLMGVAPRGLHRPYLVDPSRVDLANHRGPSTAAACQLCAGVVATEALKLLLKRGRVRAAPFHQHFDAYRGRLAVTRLAFGAHGPLQSLKRSIARRIYMRAVTRTAAPVPTEAASGLSPAVTDILALARWAPSGDNAQPWRFRPLGPETVAADIAIETGNVYEYRHGQPTFLSAGMLLETVRIAASAFGRRAEWSRNEASNALGLTIRFTADPDVVPDPLASQISVRSVDRRSFRMRALRADEKAALANACGPDLRLAWHETLAERWTFARLGARATDIRLRMPETFRDPQPHGRLARGRQPDRPARQGARPAADDARHDALGLAGLAPDAPAQPPGRRGFGRVAARHRARPAQCRDVHGQLRRGAPPTRTGRTRCSGPARPCNASG